MMLDTGWLPLLLTPLEEGIEAAVYGLKKGIKYGSVYIKV